jgi:phosphohistidine swiveling domain-containing protein
MPNDDFTPPGPGRWALDRSHFPGGTTPISQWLIEQSMAPGTRRAFTELGVPADGLQARFVDGFMYTRLRPLVRPDAGGSKLPPAIVLKALTRVHPEFRRREKTAASALRTRPWLEVARRWEADIKPALTAQNRHFQAVDPASLDDAELSRHVAELLEHARIHTEMHFWLHGHDLGPLARYLYSCQQWGIAPADALPVLAGASPSTSAPLRQLAGLRSMVEAVGVRPTSLDDVRAVSPEAAALLDDYLAQRGQLIVTRYDLDGLTLAEMPGTVLRSIVGASEPDDQGHEAAAQALRNRVPEDERAVFDEVLGDARAVMDMRDDNGPLTYEWPAGLLRRALLSLGQRLATRSRLDDAEHVLELTPAEARTILRTATPTAGDLRERAAERHRLAGLTPPSVLGPEEPAPPLDVLPPSLALMVAMVQTALAQLGMLGERVVDPLSGAGVGTDPYRGRVRIAGSPEEAIHTMEPGDVLVVRATSPAFNAVLSIAGAVVTAEGGPLSHAAVLARELGLPAVVGASGALDLRDGDLVEVDPRLGSVRVLTG